MTMAKIKAEDKTVLILIKYICNCILKENKRETWFQRITSIEDLSYFTKTIVRVRIQTKIQMIFPDTEVLQTGKYR